MTHGVIIKEGPKDWQIIQQSEGFANISLYGTYKAQGEPKKCKVLARIVLEDTGETVVNWTECKSIKGKLSEGNVLEDNLFQGNTSEVNLSIEDILEGTWSGTIEKVPAGGLYRLETCLNQDDQINVEWSRRGDMVHHIGVGDIYVIAGQSNSAGYGKDPIYDPAEPGVHVLRNSGKWDLASHPLNESTNTIHEEKY